MRRGARRIAPLPHESGPVCTELGGSAGPRDDDVAWKERPPPPTGGVTVCADAAQRGLDIPHVDLVVNYDAPRAPEDYVHRVGRTARAGRRGVAVTLVAQRDVALVHAIEAHVAPRALVECVPPRAGRDAVKEKRTRSC